MLEVCKYFLIFVLISFFGWCGEELFALFITKEKTNRGYLVGPLCPVYGFGGLLLIFILHFFGDNILTLFIASIFAFAFIEYVGSLLLEKIFNIKLWNYKDKDFKYNIQGRIALETLIPFGIIGTLAYLYAYPFLYNFINSMKENSLYAICIVIFILGLIDFIYSTIILIKIGKNNNSKDMDITNKKNENVKKQLKDTNDNVKKQLKNTNETVKRQLKKTNNSVKNTIRKTKDKIKRKA